MLGPFWDSQLLYRVRFLLLLYMDGCVVCPLGRFHGRLIAFNPRDRCWQLCDARAHRFLLRFVCHIVVIRRLVLLSIDCSLPIMGAIIKQISLISEHMIRLIDKRGDRGTWHVYTCLQNKRKVALQVFSAFAKFPLL
jgi:hypothetical protein